MTGDCTLSLSKIFFTWYDDDVCFTNFFHSELQERVCAVDNDALELVLGEFLIANNNKGQSELDS